MPMTNQHPAPIPDNREARWYSRISYERAIRACSTRGDNGRKWAEARTLPELRSSMSGAWYANDRNGFVYCRAIIAHRFPEAELFWPDDMLVQAA